MAVPATRRDGELTEESLTNALDAERRQGRRPTLLAVGSEGVEQVALRILGPHSGTLDQLRAMVPNVQIVEGLEPAEWELREA